MPRIDVTFPSADERCAAWLYLPPGSGRAPVIVMAHGLGALRQMRLDAFAERFCAAGYACLVFDYRHFGASGGEPRQLLDIDRQLTDWRAAVTFARQCDQVDGQRLVLWGTSFSGGHVLSTAADDNGITAVIAQCPFTDGLASSLAMPLGTSVSVTLRALRDQAGALLGREPLMVPLASKPGSTALMVAPDSEPGYLRLLPDGERDQFPNYVAARFALQIIRYFPGRRAVNIACPVLFCVCDPDTVAPTEATLRHARKVPNAEIKVYPHGHFEIYVDEGFEKVVTDQLKFLGRAVPGGR